MKSKVLHTGNWSYNMNKYTDLRSLLFIVMYSLTDNDISV